LRIFIGIDVLEIKQQLQTVGNLLKPSLEKFKETHVDNYHITLLFIGEVDDPNVFYDDLSAVKSEPFNLLTNHVKSFQKGSNGVFYVDILKNDALTVLHQAIYDAITKHVAISNQPYNPHITLFRSAKLKPNTDLTPFVLSETLAVKAFHVYESHQVDGKLTYTIIKTFPLV